MRVTPVLGALLAAAALAGCASDAPRTADGRLRVATTVAPITSIVAGIGGDRIDVTGIVPEGTNSHTFEPKPSVAALLSGVDVVYGNGLRLEDPTKDLADESGAEFVELGTGSIPASRYIYDFSFPRKDGKPNPHLWTDPRYALAYARIVRTDLSKRDPANAAYYAANYGRFAGQVARFDAAMRASFATIGARDRKLLTYHDAYAYFGRDYGWTVIGAIQPSDFEEPTAKDVAGLIAQVRSEKVPAVFGSEVFPSPVLEQIGRETGATYVDVLRDDDLPGEPGDGDHSWVGLMAFDFITMTEAMGGDASALRAFDATPVTTDGAHYPQ